MSTRPRKPSNPKPVLPTTFAGPVFEITVPGHPPSVNGLWFRGGPSGRFGKRRAYVVWEAAVYRAILMHGDLPTWRGMKDRPYRLTIELIRESWMTKTGTVCRPDTPNLLKAAEDAVCKITGWADVANVDTRCVKVERPGSSDFTAIKFEFA